MSRLAAELTAVLGRSQSKQTPPDGIASISPARTGLDQGVTGERPTWLRTLRSSDLVRRVAVVDRLKLCLLVLVVLASGLGLLADSEPFRTPVPIESVHRFRRFRTPVEETLLAAGAR